MRVILKRRWFVGGNRYRSVGKSPVEIPDKYRKMVPKDAVVVEEDKVEVPNEDDPDKKPYVNPAHELDPKRAFADAFSETNEKAKTEVNRLREQLKNSNKGK